MKFNQFIAGLALAAILGLQSWSLSEIVKMKIEIAEMKIRMIGPWKINP